ncbi:DUF956 family protein [Lactiplantibacillus herbarum]|uniref:DUF956 family protein n=1 Tax=Lactiplantibacillus herbarum TaxID=1670446 RepID=UPI00064E5381|nr:DUF956 family protein [Lactiplantibacillus herbarum]
MVESLNTKVELVIKGNSHLGMTDYGQIMIGDRGFEFYDERNARNYIQIPWVEVESVVVSVMFKGRWIPRYALKTKKNGMYSFSSKDPKRVLRVVRQHVKPEKIVRSLTFFDVVKRALKGKNRDNYLKK